MTTNIVRQRDEPVSSSNMASVNIGSSRNVPEATLRRSFKPSELPVTSSQRVSLDTLVNTLKRKGEFDALRKRVWADFFEGVRLLPSSASYYPPSDMF